MDGAALVTVGGRLVVALTPPDVDELSGERVETPRVGPDRLQQALEEAVEARTPSVMTPASGAVAFVGLAVGHADPVRRSGARASAWHDGKLVAVAEKTVAKTGIADVDASARLALLDFERRLVTVGIAGCSSSSTPRLTFVLRRFPFTRPWGESMIGFLLTTVEDLGLGIVRAIPGLFTVSAHLPARPVPDPADRALVRRGAARPGQRPTGFTRRPSSRRAGG